MSRTENCRTGALDYYRKRQRRGGERLGEAARVVAGQRAAVEGKGQAGRKEGIVRAYRDWEEQKRAV